MLFPTSPFDISCIIWYQKAKMGSEWACERKKWLIHYHIKGLYKITCYKTKSKFSQFFFSHWLLRKCFFSFLIKAFANFEKLIRFHWQTFIVYKNGINLKTLIEIFRQTLIVSNVILTFLDHLKHKVFFVDQLMTNIERHAFSKSLDPPLFCILGYCILKTLL